MFAKLAHNLHFLNHVPVSFELENPISKIFDMTFYIYLYFKWDFKFLPEILSILIEALN